MALKPCKECKKEVAATAPTCPHCGVKEPGKSVSVLGGALVLLIGFAVIGSMCSSGSGSSDSSVKSKAPTKTDAEKAAEAAACLEDLQCIGDKGIIAAGVKCPREIEKLAKGAVKWTDGTFETKFSRFVWKDKKNGIVTFVGDKAQFQNGFGAYLNVIYSCDMDMKNDSRILGVNAIEGRL